MTMLTQNRHDEQTPELSDPVIRIKDPAIADGADVTVLDIGDCPYWIPPRRWEHYRGDWAYVQCESGVCDWVPVSYLVKSAMEVM